MAFDTLLTELSHERLKDTGLFTEEELKYAKTWLIEYRTNPFTSDGIWVGCSPAKTAHLTGYSEKYIQTLCKTDKINHVRDYQGWYLVPTDEIIALKKKKLEKEV